MTSSPLRAACLALSVACLPVLPAMAAGSAYLAIPGIAGGSAAPSRSGQIELDGFSWGAGRETRISGGKRDYGDLFVQDISWLQKALDASTDDLFRHLSTKTSIGLPRFELVDARATGQAPTLILQTGESVVSALNLGGSHAGIGVTGSLNTSFVKLTYDPEPINGPGGVTSATYDMSGLSEPDTLTRNPGQSIGVRPALAGLYLRLGTDVRVIAGDNASRGHENWIAIDAFSMGASGVGAGGPLSVQDLSWTQRLDATSPVVLANLLGPTTIEQATLEQVVLNATQRPVTVMQLALNDVMFTSFNLGTDTNGDATVSSSMSFTSYTQTNWVLLNDGQRIGPLSVGYDLLNERRMTPALASDVGGFGRGNLNGTESDSLPIPEPQTWALLLAGLAAVLVLARRQGASRRA